MLVQFTHLATQKFNILDLLREYIIDIVLYSSSATDFIPQLNIGALLPTLVIQHGILTFFEFRAPTNKQKTW